MVVKGPGWLPRANEGWVLSAGSSGLWVGLGSHPSSASLAQCQLRSISSFSGLQHPVL